MGIIQDTNLESITDDLAPLPCRECLITQLRTFLAGWKWTSVLVAVQKEDLNMELGSVGMREEVASGVAGLKRKSHDDEGSSTLGREREKWSGKFQFFLSCLGYCVGFGNIWRFPYLVYRNGGGAFLIPYVLFLVLCGIPLVFMEMAMGQFSSLTPIHLFGKFSPLFKGLGYSMVTISFFVCIYYNTIMSWVIYYLYSSLTLSRLPWSYCDPAWASPKCFEVNQSAVLSINWTFSAVSASPSLSKDTRPLVPAAEEYWNRHVLQISDSIDSTGSLRPELLVCLAVAWLSVFLCSSKGIRTSGKVVYLTATTPFIMLLVLLVRGATLPGAIDGIELFIYPDFSRLWDFQVWTDAAMQIFYAMAPGWGGLLSFASFNDFHVNVYKYGIAIPLVNFLTSMLGGFAVFSIIGFLAHQSGIPVNRVVAEGPGLTFVAYPEALSQLPAAPVWSVLFFLTLFTIGIDSQFGMFETFMSALTDEFETVRRHRTIFCASACLLLFLLGMLCVTNAGMYWLQIIDNYCAFMTLMVICIIECVLVGYIYGAERFRRDIVLMTGQSVSYFWCISWKYLTLGTITSIFFFNFYFQKPLVYEGYVFPAWSVVVGWTLAISSIVPIPVYAFIKLYRVKGSFRQRLIQTIGCTVDFGPVKRLDRKAYLQDVQMCPPFFGPQSYHPDDDREDTSDVSPSFNRKISSSATLIEAHL